MDRGGQVLRKLLWTNVPTLVRPNNIAPVAKGYVATIEVSGLHPECPESDPSDRSLIADVLLRQEPDDEDDEQDVEDEDNEEDDGYSE
jgi:hypothetical protein